MWAIIAVRNPNQTASAAPTRLNFLQEEERIASMVTRRQAENTRPEIADEVGPRSDLNTGA